MVDVIIIGGGPAGLSAALVLGRARRSVVVVDSGQTRNRAALHMHGYLTRDGIAPAQFLTLSREELDKYNVHIAHDKASFAARSREGFVVHLESGQVLIGRKLLLATGVRDLLPEIPNFESFYGRSIHHCPYCDGWEHRDQRIVAFGRGNAAVGLALSLLTWSPHVIACSHDEGLDSKHAMLAERNKLLVCSEPVAGLEGEGGQLHRVVLKSGRSIACDALFFNTGQVQRSELPRKLGCAFDADGGVIATDRQCTGVAGMYVAGDADKEVQFVLVAAAQGATAAVAINRELQDEERGTGNH